MNYDQLMVIAHAGYEYSWNANLICRMSDEYIYTMPILPANLLLYFIFL